MGFYTNAAAFNDLGSSAYPVDSSGSSTDSESPSSCGKLCSVATGWDGPSGVGTPNGTRLAALAGLPTTPTMDAGTPPVTPVDSGTPPTTPIPDSGFILTGPDGATGISIPTPPAPGTLGASCAGTADCNSTLCAEPTAGQPAVCTMACTATDAGSTCPIGFDFDRTFNYCFPAVPGITLTLPDAGAAPSTGSTGGCAVSAANDSGWTGLGWLSLGVVGLASRRRKSRG